MNSNDSMQSNERKGPIKVLVKGLTANVNIQHVNEIFSTFGKVENVKIAYFKGHSVGWAYVFYNQLQEAETAVSEMNGGIVDGVKISVEISESTFSIEELYLKSKK